MKDKNPVIKRIMTLLLCLLIIMSGFGAKTVHAEPADSEKFVMERGDGATQKDVVIKGERRTVYCMEYDRLWPTASGMGYRDVARYWEASEDEFKLNDVQLEKITRVLYAGYPYNSVGALDPLYLNLGSYADDVAANLTQHVIWSLMAAWGVDYNTHYDANATADESVPGWIESEAALRAFADSSEPLPTEPVSITPELQGSTILLKQHDGYATGKLKITNPEGVKLSYKVQLPAGISILDENGDYIYPDFDFYTGEISYRIPDGKIFYLQTDESPDNFAGEVITIDGTVLWPTDIKQYMTSDTGYGNKNDGQGYVQHPFQTMLSIGVKTFNCSETVKLVSAEDLGSITITKTVADNSKYEAEDAEFWFELDVDIKDISGEEVGAWFPYERRTAGSTEVKTGEIYHDTDRSILFELKDGESIKIYDLPVDADYVLQEYGLSENKTDTGLGNWKPAYEGNTGKTEKETVVKVTNTYEPNYTPVDLPLSAEKRLIDKDYGDARMQIEDGQFSFALISDAEGQPMPGGITGNESTVGCGESDPSNTATVNLGTITFVEPGTYVYTVEELPVEHGNITRDHSVYTVTVEVTSDSENKLSAVKTIKKDGDSADAIEFVNEYERQTVNEEIVIFKDVINTNSDKHLSKGGFEFEIKPVGDTDPALVNGETETSVTTDDAGEAICDFTLLVEDSMFASADKLEFVYEISEKEGSDTDHWKYDDEVITATVTVTKETDGSYSSSVSYKNSKGELLTKPTFTNTYTAEEAEIAIEIIKSFAADSGYTTSDGERFRFEVIDNSENGADYSSPREITVTFAEDGSQTSSGGEFRFRKAGEYRFEIYEIDTDVPGMIYDPEGWIVDVRVSDDGSGKLKAETVFHHEGEGSVAKDVIIFTNSYTSTVRTKLDLEKVLVGRDWEIGDSFLVTVSHSEELGAAEGSASFDPCDPNNLDSDHTNITHPSYTTFTKADQSRELEIEFHKAGVYYLHLKEHASSAIDNIEFDPTEYIVEYIVGKEDGGNDLEVKDVVIYDVTAGWLAKKEVKSLRFINKVTNLTVSKADNEGSKTDEFEFTLTVKRPGGMAYTGKAESSAGTLSFNESGQTVFTLKRGESLTITGLPIDAEFETVESDAIVSRTTVTTVVDGTNTDKVTGKKASGKLEAGKMTEVRYTNIEPESDPSEPDKPSTPTYKVPDTSAK